MKVVVAKTAGFCKGVKDALEVTLNAIQQRKDGEKICTFGPLIHNRQVLKMLEEKGINEEEKIENCAGKKVVIRAHGIPPHERRALHRVNARLLDATCKRVAKVHAVIKRHARRGYHTVIVGDPDHAEVIGLMGYTEGRGIVIHHPDQVESLPKEWERVLLVAQTTQNEETFLEIQEAFLKRYPQGVVKNTICGSTHERQAEVRELCSQVEAMVIVGGYHSGNTVRLVEVARESAVPTYHVETEADLNQEEMARYSRVGISAGASTPNWMIRSVVHFLESIHTRKAGWKYHFKRIMELLSYGNLYIAVGAALLPNAMQALTGFPGSLANSLMAAFYAFAMHSLNIYLDRNAIRLNDPNRAAFYQKWRPIFTGAGVTAIVAAIWIALDLGWVPFLVMCVLILLGIFYAVPLILPSSWQSIYAFKLKDIPTSKTFSVPIAWATVTVILPYLAHPLPGLDRAIYAFWIAFLVVLVRTAMLDLLAVQGDRLVGRETIVVLFGETKTGHFLVGTLIVLALSLVVGPWIGLSTSFAYVMIPAVALYWHQLRMCFQNRLKEDPAFVSAIESTLIGVGLLGLLWNHLVQ